jgi:hypothetical protein
VIFEQQKGLRYYSVGGKEKRKTLDNHNDIASAIVEMYAPRPRL